MVQIIKAHFMHQHKDKAVLDVPIITDSLSIGMGAKIAYISFDLPIFNERYPKAIARMKPFNSVFTERELILKSSDGDSIKLPKRSYEVCLCVYSNENALLNVRFFELSKREFEWLYKKVQK